MPVGEAFEEKKLFGLESASVDEAFEDEEEELEAEPFSEGSAEAAFSECL